MESVRVKGDQAAQLVRRGINSAVSITISAIILVLLNPDVHLALIGLRRILRIESSQMVTLGCNIRCTLDLGLP